MVHIIGAGPGDPELITVKGMKLLQAADVVIYAGSLVNKALLEHLPGHCEIHDSASMTLEEVIQVMEKGHKEGKRIVRLHTGDPSIFGAVREQMDAMDRLHIPYEMVPGVSSFCAASAALKKEYTLPGVTQTVILTRMEGRTGVPEREDIEALASHHATMIIFLCVGLIEEVAEKLLRKYEKNTPAAVVYKASWPEQKVLRGTLENIAAQVKKEGVKKTALIVVGWFMGDDYELSKLYDSRFSHEYRTGRAE